MYTLSHTSHEYLYNICTHAYIIHMHKYIYSGRKEHNKLFKNRSSKKGHVLCPFKCKDIEVIRTSLHSSSHSPKLEDLVVIRVTISPQVEQYSECHLSQSNQDSYHVQLAWSPTNASFLGENSMRRDLLALVNAKCVNNPK